MTVEKTNIASSLHNSLKPDVISSAKTIADLGREVARSSKISEQARSEAELINLFQYAVVTGLTNAGGNASLERIKGAAMVEVDALMTIKGISKKEHSELSEQVSIMTRLGLDNYLTGYANQIIYGVSSRLLRNEKKIRPSHLLARTRRHIKSELELLFPNESVREKAEDRLETLLPMDIYEMSVFAEDQSLASGRNSNCNTQIGQLLSYAFKETPELFESLEQISVDENLSILRKALLKILKEVSNVGDVPYEGAILEAVMTATDVDFVEIWKLHIFGVLADLLLYYSRRFKHEPKLLWLAIKLALQKETTAGNLSEGEFVTASNCLSAIPPRDLFARAGILNQYSIYLKPDGFIKSVASHWTSAVKLEFIQKYTRFERDDRVVDTNVHQLAPPDWYLMVQLHHVLERNNFKTDLSSIRYDFKKVICAADTLSEQDRKHLLEKIETDNSAHLLLIVRCLHALRSPGSFVREAVSIIHTYLDVNKSVDEVRAELLNLMNLLSTCDFRVSNISPEKLKGLIENLTSQQLEELIESAATNAIQDIINSLGERLLSDSHCTECIHEILGASKLGYIWPPAVQTKARQLLSECSNSNILEHVLLDPPIEDKMILSEVEEYHSERSSSQAGAFGFSLIESDVIKQLLLSRAALLQKQKATYDENNKIMQNLGGTVQEKFLHLRRAHQAEAVRQLDILHERLLPGYLAALERMRRVRDPSSEKKIIEKV